MANCVTPNWKTWCGPFYRDSRTRFAQVSDGLSNTLAFGETLGGSDKLPRDYTFAWLSPGAMPTGYNMTDPPGWANFSSRHQGIVYYAYLDGSIRSLKKVRDNGYFTDQWWAYQRAGGMGDGEMLAESLLH